MGQIGKSLCWKISPCFSGTIWPIILKFGMLMARTILMDSPLVPEQNIRNFRKNSGINIFPEFSGKSRIFEISVSLLININIYAFILIILVGTTLKSHPNWDFLALEMSVSTEKGVGFSPPQREVLFFYWNTFGIQ